jgi:hypothetical protein
MSDISQLASKVGVEGSGAKRSPYHYTICEGVAFPPLGLLSAVFRFAKRIWFNFQDKLKLSVCRESDLRKNRELAQLKKETRRNESRIKSLETERRIKETVLKRKQEEVANLR